MIKSPPPDLEKKIGKLFYKLRNEEPPSDAILIKNFSETAFEEIKFLKKGDWRAQFRFVRTEPGDEDLILTDYPNFTDIISLADEPFSLDQCQFLSISISTDDEFGGKLFKIFQKEKKNF